MPKIPDYETLLREWLAIKGFDGLYLSGGKATSIFWDCHHAHRSSRDFEGCTRCAGGGSMKPGEYIGKDGKTYTVASVALTDGVDTPTATISLDGGAALRLTLHLRPDHPDFPAAVEALRALIPKPDVHPCVGRRMAMGRGEPFVCDAEVGEYRFYEGHFEYRKHSTFVWEPCFPLTWDAFEAGRCYQRERGDE